MQEKFLWMACVSACEPEICIQLWHVQIYDILVHGMVHDK